MPCRALMLTDRDTPLAGSVAVAVAGPGPVADTWPCVPAAFDTSTYGALDCHVTEDDTSALDPSE